MSTISRGESSPQLRIIIIIIIIPDHKNCFIVFRNHLFINFAYFCLGKSLICTALWICESFQWTNKFVRRNWKVVSKLFLQSSSVASKVYLNHLSCMILRWIPQFRRKIQPPQQTITTFISSYLSREHMNPKLTCSQRQWLHSSVGRASHRYREVTGSSPVEVLNFFRLIYAIAKIAIITARFILHLISYPQFTYDLFHMHQALTYLSREHMNPKLTCSQRQWLHSSVGRASHRYPARSRVQAPLKS